MIKLLPLILILASNVWANSKEVEEAKKSLKGLINPILQKGAKKGTPATLKNFSVEKCEKHKIDWMAVLMMKNSATLTYTFKPGCDIEGTITPAVLKPFPADFKLKNLESFNRLESQNKITANLEMKPILNLAIREAVLTGAKGKVKFEADYAVKINPLKKDDLVDENMGGEIRITEIYGKKVSINEKVFVE